MKKIKLLSVFLLSVLLFCACTIPTNPNNGNSETVTLENIPDYSGEPYVILNDNKPEFTSEDLTTSSYERYSKLDKLGRCGVAKACIGIDLMPTEDRESISHIIPSGWIQRKYVFTTKQSNLQAIY